MTSDVAIAATDIRAGYGRRVVLRGVSLTARFGQITAILGPNGAGKSTLLKALAGLVPCEGDVRYGEIRARDLSRQERARLLAYVPQRSALDAALSVRDVVLQGRYAHRSSPRDRKRADDGVVERVLDEVALLDFAHRLYPELSGGEQRRVLLARALATEARTILLDEPTSSLDVGHVLHLHALLERLAKDGRAIVSVLHGLDDARVHTDHAVLLSNGSIVADGSSADIVTAEPVRKVYEVDLVEAGALGFRRPAGAS